mmetsp:Transcript_23466/g.79222  ORF Transcript_23466/g.79222 Transcript_23466/m.79222 type:complete len:225 (+) Transcript_23466:524-1198(+)
MGRAWHEAGRRERKPTTFTDVVACARALIASGLVRADSLALEGRSAGGLLVGATLNRAPELFACALASVPFLDAAGTLQDGALPLTVNEWEEFGNPNEVGGHEAVLGFSPVHNVVPRARYPACLLLPALNDARTGFWEAHKFAIAIRSNGAGVEGGAAAEKEEKKEAGAGVAAPRPVLVSTDEFGGHFRPADPEERARQRAKELAFVVCSLVGPPRRPAEATSA